MQHHYKARFFYWTWVVFIYANPFVDQQQVGLEKERKREGDPKVESAKYFAGKKTVIIADSKKRSK